MAQTFADSAAQLGLPTALGGLIQTAIGDATSSNAAIIAIAALTGTVGTANDAMIAVPNAVASVGADTSAATVVSVNASITGINNNLADLQAKVNAILAALKA